MQQLVSAFCSRMRHAWLPHQTSHSLLLQVTAMVAAGPKPPKLAPAVPLDDERPQSSQQPVNISIGDGPGADAVLQRLWMLGQAWCCHMGGLLHMHAQRKVLN